MIISRLLHALASAVIANAALISIPDDMITNPTKTKAFPLPLAHTTSPPKTPEVKVLEDPVVALADNQPPPTPISYNQIDVDTIACRMVDKPVDFGRPAPLENWQAAAPHDQYIVCPTTVETVVGEVDATPVATIYTTVVRLNG